MNGEKEKKKKQTKKMMMKRGRGGMWIFGDTTAGNVGDTPSIDYVLRLFTCRYRRRLHRPSQRACDGDSSEFQP
jgi:hypothetical protein